MLPQQCSLSLMCHSLWMPPANVFYRLCPNYCKGLSLERNKGRESGSIDNLWISHCVFFFILLFLCCCSIWHIRRRIYIAGCSKLRTENSQAEALDKVLWKANKQGPSGGEKVRLRINQWGYDREFQRQLLLTFTLTLNYAYRHWSKVVQRHALWFSMLPHLCTDNKDRGC